MYFLAYLCSEVIVVMFIRVFMTIMLNILSEIRVFLLSFCHRRNNLSTGVTFIVGFGNVVMARTNSSLEEILAQKMLCDEKRIDRPMSCALNYYVNVQMT